MLNYSEEKMNTLKIGILLLISFGMIENSFAGAWTQQKGKGYYKLGFRMVRATEYYEPNGNKLNIPTFGDYTTTLYGEYGLTRRFTLIASIPFKRLTINKQETKSGAVLFDGAARNGISDGDLGIRFGLLNMGNSVLSGEINLGLPLGSDEPQDALLTGDGEFNQSFKLQFGQSLWPRPFYFSLEGGFNNRTKGYSDEFIYAAEAGYQFNPKLFLIFKARGVETLKNGNDSAEGGAGGIFGNDQRYLAFGPELVYNFTQSSGVVAGLESATRTRNVVSGIVFSVGLFFNP